MHGERRGDEVVVGGDARQRFYDASGYGRPLEGNEVALSRVEAAHLLLRGDVETVADAGERMGFQAFFADSTGDGFGVRFLVYSDLRRRGFYLSPAREGWVPDPAEDVDFVVYPRGKGPQEGDVAYRVRAVGERTAVQATDLGDRVLAVVDEESEVTYFETEHIDVDGGTETDLPEGVPGSLLADRVLLWDPPADLHRRAFYGQQLAEREGVGTDALQLSLLEAAYLAARGAVDVEAGYEGIVDAGRNVEGDRFDRRLRAYAALREAGVVPKTGFKFGADFRTYREVEDVESLGHSERLVRVVPAGHTFLPRDLALDVRLAHGVRKEMVFALVPGESDVEWLAVRRLTP
ncbi:tRNA-intron lyase [Halobacteriales archaeon QS_1_68_20]|nr:MAG: tRNA-intron lyase [Halobacteriales archaeon QS_1_68_20]